MPNWTKVNENCQNNRHYLVTTQRMPQNLRDLEEVEWCGNDDCLKRRRRTRNSTTDPWGPWSDWK